MLNRTGLMFALVLISLTAGAISAVAQCGVPGKPDCPKGPAKRAAVKAAPVKPRPAPAPRAPIRHKPIVRDTDPSDPKPPGRAKAAELNKKGLEQVLRAELDAALGFFNQA